MDFEIKPFNINKCPWKIVCGKKDTSLCGEMCPRYIKYNYLVEHSLLEEEWYLPKEFRLVNDEALSSYRRCNEIKDSVVEFVNSGKNLVIWGQTTGTGKTHMAIRILLAWFSNVWDSTSFRPRGMFIDVSKLFTEQRKTYNGVRSEYLEFVQDNIKKVDLVIFDDICQNEKLTPAQNELMFSLINAREVANRATIYTLNKTMDELLENYGDRLYSRIVRPAEVIEFNGIDKRGLF